MQKAGGEKPALSKKERAKQAKKDAVTRKGPAATLAIKDKKIQKCKVPGKSMPQKKVTAEKAWANLAYNPKATAPRHYGGVTVYVDIGRQLYRVKPAPGSRKTIKKLMTKTGWVEVVKLVESMGKP